MWAYCFIHYLRIDKKLKIKISKKSTIQKIKSKTTLNTKNQIIKSGLSVLFYIFGYDFLKNNRLNSLNTKNQIIFNSFKKSYKIKIISNKSKQ